MRRRALASSAADSGSVVERSFSSQSEIALSALSCASRLDVRSPRAGCAGSRSSSTSRSCRAMVSLATESRRRRRRLPAARRGDLVAAGRQSTDSSTQRSIASTPNRLATAQSYRRARDCAAGLQRGQAYASAVRSPRRVPARPASSSSVADSSACTQSRASSRAGAPCLRRRRSTCPNTVPAPCS